MREIQSASGAHISATIRHANDVFPMSSKCSSFPIGGICTSDHGRNGRDPIDQAYLHGKIIAQERLQALENHTAQQKGVYVSHVFIITILIIVSVVQPSLLGLAALIPKAMILITSILIAVEFL